MEHNSLYHTTSLAVKPNHTLRLLLDAMEMHSFDLCGLRRALRNRRTSITKLNRAWWMRSARSLVQFARSSKAKIRSLAAELVDDGIMKGGVA